jgi:hypothetical protein
MLTISNLLTIVNYMEVTVSEACGSLSYPYWKVVIAGDRAAVAELPCESGGSENLFFHEDLVSLLRATHPELAGRADFIAGWLTLRDDEALLCVHLCAGGLSRLDVGGIGRALADWCGSAGIRTLTIADPARRSSAGSAGADWSLQ